ncbi:hypothetical protein E2I22_00785 [Vibrio vulnificus]|uniref:Oligosaccharide repeat unit polymerase n=2 Tax=Vibrio vulnificus TaxID=672 RepID=A0A3Q0MF49_VIBVU|nr:hypothetical protein VV1_3216 [Vibrio vulnificus CMCP6]AUJ33953.1 hypothetical protein BWZ32_03165 [Vibrio vulnificus]QBN12828.1 hypothetical protein E2I22_00785 [Vibrio vulnificus]HAS6127815.1 hypothetical protein [Vibrio vulnificus]HDY7815478.1 hypothetical protein [Vibrio vulnificus]
MNYLLVMVLSFPVLCYLFRIGNMKNNPVVYSYFLGVFLFILLGSGYSLDGDNFYYRGNLESVEYMIILCFLSVSILPIYMINLCYGLAGGAYKAELKFLGKFKLLLNILLLVHLMFFLNYILSKGPYQIVSLLVQGANAKEIIGLRSELATGENAGITFIFYNLSYLLASMTILASKSRTKKFLTLIYLFFTVSIFLHKMPIIILLFAVFMTRILSNGKVNVKKIIYLTIISIILVFVFYVIYFPGRELSYYLFDMPLSIIHRIIGVYSESVALTIKHVENVGYYYGTTFINPMGLFPFEPIYLPKIIHYEYIGYDGSMSVPAVGEIYANFGTFATILYIVTLPLLIFFFERFLFSIKNRDLSLIFLVYSSILSLQLSQASQFNSYLNPKNILLFIFVFIFLNVVIRGKNTNVNKDSFSSI